MFFKIIGCVVFGGFAVWEIISIIKDIKLKKVLKVELEKSSNKK